MEASKGIQKGEKASDIELDAEEMATGTVLCKREENEGKGRQWGGRETLLSFAYVEDRDGHLTFVHGLRRLGVSFQMLLSLA